MSSSNTGRDGRTRSSRVFDAMDRVGLSELSDSLEDIHRRSRTILPEGIMGEFSSSSDNNPQRPPREDRRRQPRRISSGSTSQPASHRDDRENALSSTTANEMTSEICSLCSDKAVVIGSVTSPAEYYPDDYEDPSLASTLRRPSSTRQVYYCRKHSLGQQVPAPSDTSRRSSTRGSRTSHQSHTSHRSAGGHRAARRNPLQAYYEEAPYYDSRYDDPQ
ncbi:hypothetical protein BD324DRAFT_501107 [Kockovaella imperatae]|uniref:Uncharacterized protein n=1 Tax=Kockovaella imperatae TaxID=4999 RepID=A0A1Y1UG54_9TREE|nr:hypothetical protein BD324DRAFT_501107 [Kockovaella imperatae]ORX36496.1 hypothetical protein BD324DRAFT_501107 [Kockovaella imperatae]